MEADHIAAAVRAALADVAIREVMMFGGIGFMLNGNMLVATSKRGLLVRVGKDAQPAALARRGARAMEMRDLTTGNTILRLNSQDWPDRIGVAHVDELKSIEGIPISRSHRYQLAVEYDNTSDSGTDAMAILYLYLLERDLT